MSAVRRGAEREKGERGGEGRKRWQGLTPKPTLFEYLLFLARGPACSRLLQSSGQTTCKLPVLIHGELFLSRVSCRPSSSFSRAGIIWHRDPQSLPEFRLPCLLWLTHKARYSATGSGHALQINCHLYLATWTMWRVIRHGRCFHGPHSACRQLPNPHMSFK